jgi:hypothetical protein
MITNEKAASVANYGYEVAGSRPIVVDRISEALLTAEVAFCCLNAHVAEQELNLFKLPACLMT